MHDCKTIENPAGSTFDVICCCLREYREVYTHNVVCLRQYTTNAVEYIWFRLSVADSVMRCSCALDFKLNGLKEARESYGYESRYGKDFDFVCYCF